MGNGITKTEKSIAKDPYICANKFHLLTVIVVPNFVRPYKSLSVSLYVTILPDLKTSIGPNYLMTEHYQYFYRFKRPWMIYSP